MGPKFKTPDGKEFTVKSEWRDYMMATFYSFKNRSNEAEPLIKKPGDVDGQTFDIGDCDNVTIVLMDACEQVQIDNVKNSRIFIGACASSIFIRNCENCTFYTACRQLRLREVTNSNFYIYSMAEVHIEYSNTLKFAPFNGGYPEQAAHLKSVSLDTTNNLWYDIFDHNDPAKSHENWSLLPEAEYEAAWYPAGECTPAIPKTKPGSVVRVEDTSMATFSATQLAAGDGKDVVPAAAAVSPTKLPSAPAAAADAPPIPAVAIAGAPPAPPTPSDIIPLKNDTDLVLECIAAYANFKAGDSMNVSILRFLCSLWILNFNQSPCVYTVLLIDPFMSFNAHSLLCLIYLLFCPLV